MNIEKIQENPETFEQNYTFGDDALASERLALLARVFEPTTRVFLTRALEHLSDFPTSIVDLGAGPGHTTALLAEVLQSRRALGLDLSKSYVEEARRRFGGRGRSAAEDVTLLEFAPCDVANDPFPDAPHDFVYARHLLVHLPDPARVLERTRRALSTTGLVALEETAFLRSEDPDFTRYYAFVERLQAHHGQRMYLGSELAHVAERSGLDVLDARVAETALDPARMARLHLANLTRFRRDRDCLALAHPGELDELARRLDEVARGARVVPPVEVGIGQVLARRGRITRSEGAT